MFVTGYAVSELAVSEAPIAEQSESAADEGSYPPLTDDNESPRARGPIVLVEFDLYDGSRVLTLCLSNVGGVKAPTTAS